MRKGLILFLVIFTFLLVPQEQKKKQKEKKGFYACAQKVCIFSPLVGTPPLSKPNEEFIQNLKDFHPLYADNLWSLISASGQPENLWWIVTILRPGCENKGWCIEVNAAEEKKGAKRILITQLFLSEKESFDAGLYAKETAEKTKMIILSGKKP